MTSGAFTDSPEDLATRALRIAVEGKVLTGNGEYVFVPSAACLLLSDLARALQAERGSRGSSAEMMKQANLRTGQLEHELALVKDKLRHLRATERAGRKPVKGKSVKPRKRGRS